MTGIIGKGGGGEGSALNKSAILQTVKEHYSMTGTWYGVWWFGIGGVGVTKGAILYSSLTVMQPSSVRDWYD